MLPEVAIHELHRAMYELSDEDTLVGGRVNDYWVAQLKKIFAKYKPEERK
jgi:hypothetical protein